MDQFTSILPSIPLLAFLLILVWLAWSVLTAKRVPANEEEFDEDYELKHQTPMHCRKCRYDLRATPHRCPECGTIHVNRKEYLRRLRDEWPSNPIELRPATPSEKLVWLVNAEDEIEGSMLSEQLQARGIYCSVGKGKIAGQFLHIAHGQKQATFQEIMVYSDDLHSAKALLERWQAPTEADSEVI